MYFNVNSNVFFRLIKVHLLVSELYTCNTFISHGGLPADRPTLCEQTTTFPPSVTAYSHICSYHKHPKANASFGNLRTVDTVVTGPE